MAKIGLAGFRYAKLDTEDPATYDTPVVVGKAVSAKAAIESNSAELYADNALAESDSTFSKGTLTLEVASLPKAVIAELLGHTLAGTAIVRRDNDIAPYVGVGRVITELVNGAYVYTAEFLSKVKFAEPESDEKTKGASVDFATSSIEGTISALPNHEWSKSDSFASAELAAAFLDDCFGVES